MIIGSVFPIALRTLSKINKINVVPKNTSAYVGSPTRKTKSWKFRGTYNMHTKDNKQKT